MALWMAASLFLVGVFTVPMLDLLSRSDARRMPHTGFPQFIQFATEDINFLRGRAAQGFLAPVRRGLASGKIGETEKDFMVECHASEFLQFSGCPMKLGPNARK